MLKPSILDSAIAASLATMILRVISVVQTLVVARTLGPAEAGILGLSSLLVTLASVITFSIETAALTGFTDTDEAYAVTASSLRLRTASLLVLVGLLTAAFVSQSPLLRLVIALQVWLPLLEAMASRDRVFLQRRLQLGVITQATFRIGCLQFLMFCLALWLGLGVRGIVCVQLACAALMAVFLRVRTPQIVARATNDLRREVAGRAIRINVGGLPQILGTRTDNLMVAGALGTSALAVYSLSYGASRLPAQIVEWVSASILLPKLGKEALSGALEGLALRAISVGNFFAPLSAAAIWFFAPLAVLLLGPRWTAVEPCLRTMAFGVLLLPLLYVFGTTLTAIGKPQSLAISGVAVILWQVLAIPFIATIWGLVGAAWVDVASVSISTILSGVMCTHYGQRISGRGFIATLGMSVRIVVGGVVGAAVGHTLHVPILRETIGFVACAVVFLALSLASSQKSLMVELAKSLVRLTSVAKPAEFALTKTGD